MPQIFQAKTSRARPKQSGLTLLEIMIVLAIIAGVVLTALPRLSGQNNQMRQSVRQLTAISKQLQLQAKLQGAIYRLVIDLGKDERSPQSYWVEKSTNQTVLKPDEMDAPIGELEKKGEGEPPPQFSADNRVLKGKQGFPSGLRVSEVELKRKEQPISSGKAYVHFFPQGLAEEAAIHLRASEKLQWTLAVHPLTGRSSVYPEKISLREIQGR